MKSELVNFSGTLLDIRFKYDFDLHSTPLLHVWMGVLDRFLLILLINNWRRIKCFMFYVYEKSNLTLLKWFVKTWYLAIITWFVIQLRSYFKYDGISSKVVHHSVCQAVSHLHQKVLLNVIHVGWPNISMVLEGRQLIFADHIIVDVLTWKFIFLHIFRFECTHSLILIYPFAHDDLAICSTYLPICSFLPNYSFISHLLIFKNMKIIHFLVPS